MVWLSDNKVGEVDAARVFRQSVWMSLEFVGLEVQLRFENDEFLFQALLVQAQEVILSEMGLESVVVQVVVWPAWRSSVAYVAPLVLLAAVSVQFIIAVEVFSAESTLGMSPKSALIDSARLVVSTFLMLSQLLSGKQVMLVGENLLVLRTEVAHDLLVRLADVVMQVRPAQAGDIAL
jgi:hypothetical protein